MKNLKPTFRAAAKDLKNRGFLDTTRKEDIIYLNIAFNLAKSGALGKQLTEDQIIFTLENFLLGQNEFLTSENASEYDLEHIATIRYTTVNRIKKGILSNCGFLLNYYGANGEFKECFVKYDLNYNILSDLIASL